MFSTIIKNILFSITIIVALHFLWNYLKDTYSKKKNKHLVNIQIEKYKKIVKEMQESAKPSFFESEEEKQQMNRELLEFVDGKIEYIKQNKHKDNAL